MVNFISSVNKVAVSLVTPNLENMLHQICQLYQNKPVFEVLSLTRIADYHKLKACLIRYQPEHQPSFGLHPF